VFSSLKQKQSADSVLALLVSIDVRSVNAQFCPQVLLRHAQSVLLSMMYLQKFAITVMSKESDRL
jgi:hypothetical protein